MRTRGVVLAPNTPCINIDTLVQNLSTTEYRFNKPEEAFVHEPFRVVLLLPTAPGQDLDGPFKATRGKVETRVAPYAQYMEARLHGDPDLKITPSGPQERTITSITPTTWEWSVTPEQAGNKTLIIEVNAQLVIGPDKSRVQLRTIYETIRVDVRFSHHLSSLWQSVRDFIASVYGILLGLGTITIAVLGILHYRRTHKTEEIPGADLVAHSTQHKDHDKTAGHPPDGHDMPP
jgi:hypothetical protein